jgi:hypothetical protein
MGSVLMETTIAHWYSHMAKDQAAAIDTFKAELAAHGEATRKLRTDGHLDWRVLLPKAEKDALGKRIAEIGIADLSFCFVEPRQLINGYGVALWLPCGSHDGRGSAHEHKRLGARFRDLAIGSGATVLVAWDYDLGEAHGHEYWTHADDGNHVRVPCTPQNCANLSEARDDNDVDSGAG